MKLPASFCVFLLLSGVAHAQPAEPSVERVAYWWADELRTVAWDLSRARTGQVSQWPKLTVSVGSATLPLPLVDEPITIDGRLDETAWSHATRFPVGPLFGPWTQGPCTLQVSACRDEISLYLAIVSPIQLDGLGSLAKEAELFRVDAVPFRIGKSGGLPPNSVVQDDGHQVIELALPRSKRTKPVTLSFPVELVRHEGTKLPAQFASLGLAQHGKTLWLEPITIRLVPDKIATRFTLSQDARSARLFCQQIERAKKTRSSEQTIAENWQEGVRSYLWQNTSDGKPFRFEGFVYREPVLRTVQAARTLFERVRHLRGPLDNDEQTLRDVQELESAVQQSDDMDRTRWRDLYCRARRCRAAVHLRLLDAPLLFVKRHPYFAGHIYDDFYTWHPGGGIYIRRHPDQLDALRDVQPVIDPTTPETLGGGVYRDPDVSWDGRRVLFAYKPEAEGVTSIYEIGADGRGLKRLTRSDIHHDISPSYLPDGRIVFLSTRPRALVPCFNSGVATLHTMSSDGGEICSISVNNVNEFDPTVMPDGRILYGRWEYVDKTALYMQSLWTMRPDGRMESSLFANNLARPTAILDARPVPGTELVMASLTPHNGQAVGAIATIDPSRGKNSLLAITNFTPEYPARMDQGLRVGPCDPRPISANDALIANNAMGAHGIIELIDREGHRELVQCDPEFSCYAPMLIKPRSKPSIVSSEANRFAPRKFASPTSAMPQDMDNRWDDSSPPPPTVVEDKAVDPLRPDELSPPPDESGRFFVLDIYRGLEGIPRGTITRLRIIEETARTSGIPPGGRWWNQAFLVSWQGAYSVKNVLGTVPVYPDGSAYFEVPADRALYFAALDADGREIQRMRTFVQAASGTTRSCIGCHERKSTAPARLDTMPLAMRQPPARPAPESWGSGLIDYPTMIQPILDRQCVRCHGGEDGIAGGIDLSGGWTWAFNISYETLLKNRLSGFLRCHNSDVTSSDILPPCTIGSAAAPLAELLLTGHEGHIPNLSHRERDLLLAWMDGNSNYYGAWDYTPYATCDSLLAAAPALLEEMRVAGCLQCHNGKQIGNDWVNLQHPEWSRILRAPLAQTDDGLGLAWCRRRKPNAGLTLVTQRILPPDVFHPLEVPTHDDNGGSVLTFSTADDPHYQRMLQIIRRVRAEALSRPRVDMPGADLEPGVCRRFKPVPLPETLPELDVQLTQDKAVRLSWAPAANTIGLGFEVHRGTGSDFATDARTQIGWTTSFRFTDFLAPSGRQNYALVAVSAGVRSAPVRAAIDVPLLKPPPAPAELAAVPGPQEITLHWNPIAQPGVHYDIYRSDADATEFEKLNREPISNATYVDGNRDAGVTYLYSVCAVDRRGRQSAHTPAVRSTALSEIHEPVFVAPLHNDAKAVLRDGTNVLGRLSGRAKFDGSGLDLRQGGYVTFLHRAEFDLRSGFSVACWVFLDRDDDIPVIVSCGRWRDTGWFLQRFGAGWRWHVGGVDCDGGTPAVGRWTHLIGSFDGHRTRLFQDGVEVTGKPCDPNAKPWLGPLFVGQYGAAPGPRYQVTGRIGGLKIYRRNLQTTDAAAAFQAGKP